jgi:hypothetical protein
LTPKRGLDALPLALRGLDPELTYAVEGLKQSWSGGQLMARGFVPEMGQGDYQSAMYRLQGGK